jgi:hypothetical protein
MPFRKTPAFLSGCAGEQRVAAFLQARKWFILPAYDYSGPAGDRAPKLQGVHAGIVMPDLFLAAGGRTKWAEVKCKGAPTFTVITHTLDHGIGLRKWRHYMRCQEVTGVFVWLFILEVDSQTLRFQSLDKLGVGRIYPGDQMDPGGMMFWSIDKFGFEKLDAIPGLYDPTLPLSFEE